ncbi:hypothetical protein N0V90_010688 [Kalmusia sp. IMI 367209]|nr:hypothetical protein N0V90_010688 [Kalmusia sp. IMI 367209]
MPCGTPQGPTARDEPETFYPAKRRDDWANVLEAVEKRRMQNRSAQRNFREKLRIAQSKDMEEITKNERQAGKNDAMTYKTAVKGITSNTEAVQAPEEQRTTIEQPQHHSTLSTEAISPSDYDSSIQRLISSSLWADEGTAPVAIKCVCDFTDDTRHIVQCEKCESWQHIACYYKNAKHIVEIHECVTCSPRYLGQHAKTTFGSGDKDGSSATSSALAVGISKSSTGIGSQAESESLTNDTTSTTDADAESGSKARKTVMITTLRRKRSTATTVLKCSNDFEDRLQKWRCNRRNKADPLGGCCQCFAQKTQCTRGLPRCETCEKRNSHCEYYDPAKGHHVVILRDEVIRFQEMVQTLESQLRGEVMIAIPANSGSSSKVSHKNMSGSERKAQLASQTTVSIGITNADEETIRSGSPSVSIIQPTTPSSRTTEDRFSEAMIELPKTSDDIIGALSSDEERRQPQNWGNHETSDPLLLSKITDTSDAGLEVSTGVTEKPVLDLYKPGTSPEVAAETLQITKDSDIERDETVLRRLRSQHQSKNDHLPEGSANVNGSGEQEGFERKGVSLGISPTPYEEDLCSTDSVSKFSTTYQDSDLSSISTAPSGNGKYRLKKQREGVPSVPRSLTLGEFESPDREKGPNEIISEFLPSSLELTTSLVEQPTAYGPQFTRLREYCKVRNLKEPILQPISAQFVPTSTWVATIIADGVGYYSRSWQGALSRGDSVEDAAFIALERMQHKELTRAVSLKSNVSHTEINNTILLPDTKQTHILQNPEIQMLQSVFSPFNARNRVMGPSDRISETPRITRENMLLDHKKRKFFPNITSNSCLTCRRRKKRCDAERPSCNNCKRGGFICEGHKDPKPPLGMSRLQQNNQDMSRSVTDESLSSRSTKPHTDVVLGESAILSIALTAALFKMNMEAGPCTEWHNSLLQTSKLLGCVGEQRCPRCLSILQQEHPLLTYHSADDTPNNKSPVRTELPTIDQERPSTHEPVPTSLRASSQAEDISESSTPDSGVSRYLSTLNAYADAEIDHRLLLSGNHLGTSSLVTEKPLDQDSPESELESRFATISSPDSRKALCVECHTSNHLPGNMKCNNCLSLSQSNNSPQTQHRRELEASSQIHSVNSEKGSSAALPFTSGNAENEDEKELTAPVEDYGNDCWRVATSSNPGEVTLTECIDEAKEPETLNDCFCGRHSPGAMVSCANNECRNPDRLFHLDCLDSKELPVSEDWLCPSCKGKFDDVTTAPVSEQTYHKNAEVSAAPEVADDAALEDSHKPSDPEVSPNSSDTIENLLKGEGMKKERNQELETQSTQQHLDSTLLVQRSVPFHEDTLISNQAREDRVSHTMNVARKRTKTGCLTCRKRRIKCGEERPSCTNCIKSKRQCEGYNPRIVFQPPIGDWANHTGMYPGSTVQDFKTFLHTGDQSPYQPFDNASIPSEAVALPVEYSDTEPNHAQWLEVRSLTETDSGWTSVDIGRHKPSEINDTQEVIFNPFQSLHIRNASDSSHQLSYYAPSKSSGTGSVSGVSIATSLGVESISSHSSYNETSFSKLSETEMPHIATNLETLEEESSDDEMTDHLAMLRRRVQETFERQKRQDALTRWEEQQRQLREEVSTNNIFGSENSVDFDRFRVSRADHLVSELRRWRKQDERLEERQFTEDKQRYYKPARMKRSTGARAGYNLQLEYTKRKLERGQRVNMPFFRIERVSMHDNMVRFGLRRSKLSYVFEDRNPNSIAPAAIKHGVYIKEKLELAGFRLIPWDFRNGKKTTWCGENKDTVHEVGSESNDRAEDIVFKESNVAEDISEESMQITGKNKDWSTSRDELLAASSIDAPSDTAIQRDLSSADIFMLAPPDLGKDIGNQTLEIKEVAAEVPPMSSQEEYTTLNEDEEDESHSPHYLANQSLSDETDWKDIRDQLPEDWMWDVDYHATHSADGNDQGCWTCTPSEFDDPKNFPLTISGAPVVIPVEYQWPPMAGVNPPPDPRPSAPIDCTAELSLEVIRDIFLTFKGSIGFYLLINGLLQILVPETFDREWASSHLPHKFGGLKISYINRTMEPTATLFPSKTETVKTQGSQATQSSGMSSIFRSSRTSTSSSAQPLRINDFIEARAKSSHRKEKFAGRIGLKVTKCGDPYLIMSTHVITEAILAKSQMSTLLGRRNHFEKLDDDWNEHVEIWAGNEKIGTIHQTFDSEAELYPNGFKHDITLIKPSPTSQTRDITSPILNLGWLSRSAWHTLRQRSSSIKLLPPTDSHRCAKTLKCSTPSQVLVVGEGIFLNQSVAKPTRDHDISTWKDLVSRAVLYRVNPDFDPPTGYSGTALYAEGTREDRTEGPGVVGFQSFVQRSGHVQNFEMEGGALDKRLKLGRVAFYGAFELPEGVKTEYQVV